MYLEIALYVLAGLLMLVGIAGSVLPALPGLPVVWVGMLIAAWTGGFQHIGWPVLALLALLVLMAQAVDVLAGILGAKQLGASRRALVGATLGTLVGMFFGLPGLLLGPFLGALLGELSAGNSVLRSTHVGFGAWLGFVVGSVLKLTLGFTMLGVFLLALWL